MKLSQPLYKFCKAQNLFGPGFFAFSVLGGGGGGGGGIDSGSLEWLILIDIYSQDETCLLLDILLKKFCIEKFVKMTKKNQK